MFSGGVDSTHVLVNLLCDTDDIVLAHHVHLINRELRHQAEAQACRNIVQWCRKNYRDFFYSESTIDRSRFRAPGYDVIAVASEGGIAACNFLIDTGKMPDHWLLGINAEEYNDVSVTSEGRLGHILAAMAASCFPNPPPAFTRPKIRPKAELIADLGPELAALCWTCRRPVKSIDGFVECGECKTCKLIEALA